MWSKLADLGLEIVNHQTVIIRGKVYVIGGYKEENGYGSQKISVFVASGERKTHRCVRLNVNITYVWDCLSKLVVVEESNVNPMDRFGHTVILWKQMGVLFGGRSNNGVCDPDIYLFIPAKRGHIMEGLPLIDIDQELWVKIHGIGGNAPSKRDGHCSTLHEDNMFVFGGLMLCGNTRYYDNRLYQLDLQHWQWTIIYHGDYLEPLGRDFCQLLTHKDCLYLLGGRSDNCYLGITNNDVYDTALWRFNLNSRKEPRQWKCIHPGYGIICAVATEISHNNFQMEDTINSMSPHPRRSFMAVVLKDELILFGGLYENSDVCVHFNDLWSFDLLQRKWSCLLSNLSNKYGNSKPLPLRKGSLTKLNNHCALLIGGISPVTHSTLDTTKIFGKSFKFPVKSRARDFHLVEGEGTISGICDSSQTSVSTYHLSDSLFSGSIHYINDSDLKSIGQVFLLERHSTLYQMALSIVVKQFSTKQLRNYYIPMRIIFDIESCRTYSME